MIYKEPGEVADLSHGLPGETEPMPVDEPDEETLVNDDEEEEDE